MAMKTLKQVVKAGISALVESLGRVDTVRFLQQFDSGTGDYTAERNKILGDPTVDEVMAEIKKMRKAG